MERLNYDGSMSKWRGYKKMDENNLSLIWVQIKQHSYVPKRKKIQNKYKNWPPKREIQNNAFTIRPPSQSSEPVRKEGGIMKAKIQHEIQEYCSLLKLNAISDHFEEAISSATDYVSASASSHGSRCRGTACKRVLKNTTWS